MNKLFSIFLIALITLTILPNVLALTYRTDLNNGSWSGYNSGLSSIFYQTDLDQNTYNRNFDTNFYFSKPSGTTQSSCQANLCWWYSGQSSADDEYVKRDTNGQSGTYLAKINSTYDVTFSGQSELISDSNVSFYFKGNPTTTAGYFLNYGTISDSNVFTSAGNLSKNVNWVNYSFVAPSQNSRWAFHIYTNYFPFQETFFDNIVITRNNSGTFFKGSSAPFCSSISSCSNVTDANNLKSNASRDLYWIVDYVSGASCPVYEKNVFKGNMVEMGSTGTYYYKIQSKAYPSTYIDTNLSTSCTKVPYASKGFFAAPRIYNDANIVTTITTGNTLVNNVGAKGDIVTFWTKYYDDLNTAITDGTCTLTVDGSTNAMTYNSSTQRYEYKKGFIANNTYAITHTCTKSNYNSATSTYNVLIGSGFSANIIVSQIANVSSYSINPILPIVSLISSNNYSDVIFSVLNGSSSSTINFLLSNNDQSGKQYFIYTSSDGTNWVFNDTLTYGASPETTLQKIWNTTTETYDYNFTDTIVVGTRTYYKLVYQAPALYWETINNSSDWINMNQPENYNDPSNKNYDNFQDSNYTNIQSYTSSPYQNLTSSSLTVGYELQFTAYATTTGNLKVGYRSNGTDTTTTISIGTTPKRFSVPIAPNAREAVLLISSSNLTSNLFTLTDYALVPRSYFVGQLELKNSDYTELQAILRNGVSQQYVMEGKQVRVNTQAYDTNGNLSKIEFQTLINGVVVKDQFIQVNSGPGQSLSWNQLIEGVIDLNGIGGELITSGSLRTITYKTILWNTSNQSVAQQYKSVSLLQYPYFPTDLRMGVDILNSKLGTNPTMRFSIQQNVPENFLGIVVNFFDGAHSIASPNYSETIYASTLACTDLSNCTKQLTFDKYVWDGTDYNFTVQVTALLSTENKNYTDAYANVTRHVVVTPAGYLLAQMKQYMERRFVSIPHTPYKNTERIPLVLGVIDDTGKNLGNTLTPYFTLNVNGSDYTTKYFADSFGYDETTGNNFWMWNQYLYDDSGNLLADGVAVKFHGVLVDKRQTQTTSNQYALTNRCTFYPVDLLGGDANYLVSWWNGGIGTEIFNWQIQNNSSGFIQQMINLYGSAMGSIGLNGCIGYPPNIVNWGDGNESLITIDNTYTPTTDNRQALYCGQKYDNNVPTDQLTDKFGCVLFLHEAQTQIDGVHIQIGNENSDYSVVNDNKQYIDFTITGNDIMFTDLGALLRNWNQKGYFGASPTGSPTIEDVIATFWHNAVTPQLSNSQIMDSYHFTQLMGGDGNFNFKTDLNNDVFNKAIFFTIENISMINSYDYLTKDQLSSFNTKNFLSYARENNFNVPTKKAKITIYNNADSAYKVIDTTAPIIIKETPSFLQTVVMPDGNIGRTVLPATINLKVISTMMSANQTMNDRLIAALSFQQIITANPQAVPGENALVGATKWINDVLVGKDANGRPIGLLNAPLVFITNPVIIILAFVILTLALVVSLMIKNVFGMGKK